MSITPEATMTDNWRKEMAKYIHDKTTQPSLETFIWGDGGHITDVALTGDITNGSDQITNVTDFTNLKVTQLVEGTGISEGTYVSEIDETAQTVTMTKNAAATQAGAALTLTGPKKEDPARTDLFNRITGSEKAILAGDKQLSGDEYSTTYTGSIEDTELEGENISEFGILDNSGNLAYYFTFREVLKTIGEAYQLQITVKF